MAEAIITRRWRYRLLFVFLAAVVMFFQLLPLDAGPGGLPGPDWLLLLGCAFVVRRPNYLPVTLAAVVYLLTDVMYLRPLGLWAAISVLGLEFLRTRQAVTRELPFLVEWAMLAAVIVAMTISNTLILAIFRVDQPALGLSLIQMIATILAYPLVVLFASRILGLRKMAPGEVDQLGHRL